MLYYFQLCRQYWRISLSQSGSSHQVHLVEVISFIDNVRATVLLLWFHGCDITIYKSLEDNESFVCFLSTRNTTWLEIVLQFLRARTSGLIHLMHFELSLHRETQWILSVRMRQPLFKCRCLWYNILQPVWYFQFRGHWSPKTWIRNFTWKLWILWA